MTSEELLKFYSEGRRDFRGADLSNADLSYAHLSYARLSRLSHADLSFADLSHADLSHADLPDIGEIDRSALRAAVATQISEHPESHDQGEWHSSYRTRHCVAGWTIVLAGEVGDKLESELGTSAAAALLLGGRVPDFGANARREDILATLRS